MIDGMQKDRHLRYLLGELADAEHDAVEEEYFSSDAAYAELLAAEETLFDQYRSGTLEPARRKRFEERYFSTSEGRSRIAIDRSLRLRAARRAARSPGWAAGLAAAVVAAALLGYVVHLHGQIRSARSERESLDRSLKELEQRTQEQAGLLAGLDAEVERLRSQSEAMEELLGTPATALKAVSLVLTSAPQRDGGSLPRLVLPPDASLVRLRLRLGAGTRATCRASLQSDDGRELWSRSGLRVAPASGGGEVTLTVPAALLAPGHYVVSVTEDGAGPRSGPIAEFVFQRVRAP